MSVFFQQKGGWFMGSLAEVEEMSQVELNHVITQIITDLNDGVPTHGERYYYIVLPYNTVSECATLSQFAARNAPVWFDKIAATAMQSSHVVSPPHYDFSYSFQPIVNKQQFIRGCPSAVGHMVVRFALIRRCPECFIIRRIL